MSADGISLTPVTMAEARAFVAAHHRHNEPPVTARFCVGVSQGGELVGVGIAGLPKSRMLMDGRTLEVVRTCTTGAKNANSMLYGALARAAKALGYARLITYTLESESGSSLRAAGWVVESIRPTSKAWTHYGTANVETPTLFGTRKHPTGPKIRWVKVIDESALAFDA